MFEEFAGQVLATIDEIAERIRMIGQDPVSGLVEFQQRAAVHSAARGRSMREMVEEADANAMQVIRDMRQAVKAAEENNDPGTVDMFSRFVQVHEKHEWFLRETLKKRDGLVS